MRKRIGSKTKSKYKKTILSVVNDLGRSVEIYKEPTKYECFNCYFDSLTGKSTNKCKWTLAETIQKQNEYESSGGIGLRYKYFSRGRCPICRGNGYLETTRKTRITCKVTWSPKDDNDNLYTIVGKEGETVVELKTDPKYYNTFKNATKVFVDNVECKIAAPPIMRGLGNNSVLVIHLYTEYKPDSDPYNLKRYNE